MPGFAKILQCKLILIIKLNNPETIYLTSYLVLREVPKTFSLLEKWKAAKEPVEKRLTLWWYLADRAMIMYVIVQFNNQREARGLLR